MSHVAFSHFVNELLMGDSDGYPRTAVTDFDAGIQARI